jgi:hypothetical protein
MREGLRRPEIRWLIAVFALAFIVRLIVALAVTPDPRDGRFDDSVFYDSAARHLADGDGYVFDTTVWFAPDGTYIFPNQPETTPTALWPPGYPLTLAAVYAVTDDSVAAGRFANVVFGSVTAALVYLIALRLFVHRAQPGAGVPRDRTLLPAIGAGVAIAIMPSHVLFTSILLSETFFGFMLAATLAFAVYFVLGRERAGRSSQTSELAARRVELDASPALLWAPAVLGAMIAFTGLVRGEFVAFGVVVALLMIYERRAIPLAQLAALLGGAVLVIAPWTIRNEITMGEAITGTTGSGRVMWQGHNPDSDGGPSLDSVFKLEQDILRDNPGIGLKELELLSRREGTRRAREWALDHPLDEIALAGKRMHLLFRSDEAGVTWLQSNKPWFSPENRDRLINLSTAYFWGVAALLVASAPVWWRPRDARLLMVLAVIPYYMLIFGVLFIGDPRYHYALYVPMAVFGGAGFAAVARITATQWRETFGGRPLGSVLRTYGAPER